jgi:FAD/FMN-containing dehydrogenase
MKRKKFNYYPFKKIHMYLELTLLKSFFKVFYILGAKGSCHIGGNVATNAGGLRLLR